MGRGQGQGRGRGGAGRGSRLGVPTSVPAQHLPGLSTLHPQRGDLPFGVKLGHLCFHPHGAHADHVTSKLHKQGNSRTEMVAAGRLARHLLSQGRQGLQTCQILPQRMGFKPVSEPRPAPLCGHEAEGSSREGRLSEMCGWWVCLAGIQGLRAPHRASKGRAL